METAADHLRRIGERMEKAARHAGRNPKDITLVAVTKTVPLERVLPFIQTGIRHVGENRIQEALEKYAGLAAGGLVRPQFHLIGQLQSNKAKKAVGFFDMIQSLDRFDLAQDINRHAEALGKKQACLVEIKISTEATKSGLPPENLEEFLGQLKGLTSLEIKGLMGIAPAVATAEETRPYFSKLRKLFEKSRLEVLSMGMSSDFEIAIEEGSTMVRLGTSLFGSRTNPL